MHFRVRKHVIQLVRTTYEASRKKGVFTIVGTVSRVQPDLSDELKEQMTHEEVIEFNEWLSTQHRKAELQEELAALNLAVSMDEARKWFEKKGETNHARQEAMNIVNKWQVLRKVFSKYKLLD